MSEPKLVTRSRHGYVLHLGRDERALVTRLLGELRTLLTDPDADPALLHRLYPVVHPDHADREEEYQRLMRSELVTSRLAGLDALDEVLGSSGRKIDLDEAQLLAFMQAVNSVRLVLGTLLDLGEEDELDEDDPPEHHLYGYLSWILDAAVRAMSDAAAPGAGPGGSEGGGW